MSSLSDYKKHIQVLKMEQKIGRIQKELETVDYGDECPLHGENDCAEVRKAYDRGYVSGLYEAMTLFKLIKAVPSADRPQGWIPCSERLPDLEEYVLVTLECGETMIMALDWDDGKIEWKTQEESLIYDDEEVIAWQPLPKPWKGADDDFNS